MSKKFVLSKKAKRALIIAAIVIAIVAGGVIFALAGGAALILKWLMPDYHYSSIPEDPSDLGFTEVIDERIVNIALFGIDARKPDSFKGLSDSIMVMSLDTEKKTVKLISLMRDSLVPIDRNGKTTYGKLNSAYSRGGATLAISTINKCYNLDISEYVTVNFYGLADIIDAVGGIDAELTKAEVTSHGTTHQSGINDYIREICKYMNKNAEDYYIKEPGKQHLNGIQAVGYSRIRYVSNIWGTRDDFGRTDRQRYVLEQLFNKAKTMQKTQYYSFAKSLLPYVETSLNYKEIVNLATSILLESPTFTQTRVPQYSFLMTAPKGAYGSALYYDLDYAGKVIHGIIYDGMTLEEYVKQNPVQKNDWFGQRNPQKTTSKAATTSGGTTATGVQPKTSATDDTSAATEPTSTEATEAPTTATETEPPTTTTTTEAEQTVE